MFELIKIYRDQKISPERLLDRMSGFGYRRVESVAEPGDFSRRGGIIDVFPLHYHDPVRLELEGDRVVTIRSFVLATGDTVAFEDEASLLPVGKAAFRAARRMRDFFGGGRVPVESLAELETGELVVHVDHGIGRFLGVERIRTREGEKTCLALEYADGDRLYIPEDKMYLVQRYVAFFGRHPPRLSQLGSGRWAQAKKRTEDGVTRLAAEMLELAALRNALNGFAFSPDSDWQQEFEKAFPHPETPDQKQTLREVKRDMESEKPMDRLICGDVGYGKTEVALRAAFKAVMDNKQAGMLVPTTILAEQHYHTFRQRLEGYPVRVEMLSRFRTPEEQKAALAGLAAGTVDVVIGTHRLLSGDVKFRDLGLVIIDEEQRFGVRHKEKLKKLRTMADILTLTATPIPRTLYLSLMGVKDMSVINTPPKERIPIETYVAEYDEALIRNAVRRELKREGQVFFVHYRVNGIDRLARHLQELVPGARIETAHGQMPERALESVMQRFTDGRIDVLVATNIVESGLDIPNVNTIVVNRADTFGLADLYQLRGRVGRSTTQAYAYFLIPRNMVLTRETEKRLRSIEKFTDLGSGFRIAMEDLEIRGAGNLLGPEQHGYIQAVGFDLYCRLLRQAVRHLRPQEETVADAEEGGSQS